MSKRFHRQPESSSDESQSQTSINTNVSSDTDSGIQHSEELRQLGFKNLASENIFDSQDFMFEDKAEKRSSSEKEMFYSTEQTMSKFEKNNLNCDEKSNLKKKWLKSVDPVTLGIIQVV